MRFKIQVMRENPNASIGGALSGPHPSNVLRPVSSASVGRGRWWCYWCVISLCMPSPITREELCVTRRCGRVRCVRHMRKNYWEPMGSFAHSKGRHSFHKTVHQCASGRVLCVRGSGNMVVGCFSTHFCESALLFVALLIT